MGLSLQRHLLADTLPPNFPMLGQVRLQSCIIFSRWAPFSRLLDTDTAAQHTACVELVFGRRHGVLQQVGVADMQAHMHVTQHRLWLLALEHETGLPQLEAHLLLTWLHCADCKTAAGFQRSCCAAGG